MPEMQVPPVVVVVVVTMVVIMMVMTSMVMRVAVPLDAGCSTSANVTHHTTSRSLILISSPDTGISLPPLHSGQGANRSLISTSFMQS